MRVDKGLLECDFGDWTGAELKRLRRKREWNQVQTMPSAFAFPGGESFGQMQIRIMATIDKLSLRHAGRSFVAVSHADPIKAAFAAAAGIHLDMFQRLVVSPCSVTAVVRGEAQTHVLCLNSVGSLAELGVS